MATFVIGDVHGCWASLEELLGKLPEKRKLIFIGDLINRGPDSLKCLQYAMSLGDKAQCLIGNHEMHLLGVAAGIRELHPKDTLRPILEAPDAQEMIDWVRFRPLALEKKDYLCVHAGVHPLWNRKDALKYAKLIEDVLRSDNWKERMKELFGKQDWDPNKKGKDQLTAIVNVLTRMRYFEPDGKMDFKAKLGPEASDPSLIPWFKFPNRKTEKDKIVFGHWSTLGPVEYSNIYPTDLGCLWGGSLKALSLSKKAPSEVVKAVQYLSPKEA